MLVSTSVSEGDEFGRAVAASSTGNLLVVGAPGSSTPAGPTSGSVLLFDTTSIAPSLIAELMPTYSSGLVDGMGTSVAVSSSGGTVVTGAPGCSDGGCFFVFRRLQSGWTQLFGVNPRAFGSP